MWEGKKKLFEKTYRKKKNLFYPFTLKKRGSEKKKRKKKKKKKQRDLREKCGYFQFFF